MRTELAVNEDGQDMPPALKPREVPEGGEDSDGCGCGEEIDIDLEDPEVEQAATRIQAAFRGHRARREQEVTMQPADPTKEELEAEFNPNDKELCHAATKIQASFRGHVARKAATKDVNEEVDKAMAKDGKEKEDSTTQLEDELADIDLSDPDLHKAATKIQASFRGHKVRKEGTPEGGP